MPTFVAAGSNQNKTSSATFSIATTAACLVGDMIVFTVASTQSTAGYFKTPNYTSAEGLLFTFASGFNTGGAMTCTYQHIVTSALPSGQVLSLSSTTALATHVCSFYIFRPSSGETFQTALNSSDSGYSSATLQNFTIDIYYNGIISGGVIPAGSIVFESLAVNGPNTITWGITSNTAGGVDWLKNDSTGSTTTPISIFNGTTGQGAASNISLRQTYKIPTSDAAQQLQITQSASSFCQIQGIVFRVTAASGGSDPMGEMGIYGL